MRAWGSVMSRCDSVFYRSPPGLAKEAERQWYKLNMTRNAGLYGGFTYSEFMRAVFKYKGAHYLYSDEGSPGRWLSADVLRERLLELQSWMRKLHDGDLYLPSGEGGKMRYSGSLREYQAVIEALAQRFSVPYYCVSISPQGEIEVLEGAQFL